MLHFSIQLPNTHKHAHTHRAIAICDQVSNLKTFWMEFRAIFSKIASISISFFSIWVFFYEHSQFTGQQGKREGIYLTPLYHFHQLHRHLNISGLEPGTFVFQRKSLTTKLRALKVLVFFIYFILIWFIHSFVKKSFYNLIYTK